MREDPTPKGKIVVVDYSMESASGHYDETRTVTLSGGGDNNLTLTEATTATDQYKSGSEQSSKSWKIDRELLVDLIQKHGTRA